MNLLISLLLLAGCDRPSAAECLDNTMCEPGFVCYEQACRAAECTDSTQCGIQQYCDPRSFRCSDGCLTADDCMAGEACNTQTRTCTEAACRTTELDCPVGEFCDTVTGDCFASDDPLCSKSCDVGSLSNSCPAGTACEVTTIGDTCRRDADCESGWFCDLFTDNVMYCHQDFCLTSCRPADDDPCPAGFTCVQGSVGNVCYGDCGWYKENGYL